MAANTWIDQTGAYHWTGMDSAPSGAPAGTGEGSTWATSGGVKYLYNRVDGAWSIFQPGQVATFFCRAATTANVTIATAFNNGDTLDGVTLATGDAVLAKNQSTAAENGIYIVAASPARATYFDDDAEFVSGVEVRVSEGTVNADTRWECTTNGTITVGTTSTTWAKASGNTTGPTTSVDERLVTFNGTTGNVQDDTTITATGAIITITGAGQLRATTSLALGDVTNNPTITIPGSGAVTVTPATTFNGATTFNAALNHDALVTYVLTVPNTGGGGTAALATLQLNDIGNTAIATARQVLVMANLVQYEPPGHLVVPVATVTHSLATTGAIIASGNGWALIQTNASGAAAWTISDSADETVHFTCRTAAAVSVLAEACLVVGGVGDSATWSA